MHNRFRRACYAMAGGVAVTAALGLTAAGAANASTGGVRPATPDATTTCGHKCNDLFNLGLGAGFIASTNGHYASFVGLAPAHNFDPGQDFIATRVGNLGQMIANGLISPRSYVALKYPHFWPVFEEQFAPGSFTSGLCAAVRKNRVQQGAAITLRDCGTSARSLWVADLRNAVPDPTSVFGFDWPWVNGADAAFSLPLVLTADDFGNLTLQELAKNGGKVGDNQEFGVNPGPAV
jgi:hypothetical protein